jgi:putative membrane protein
MRYFAESGVYETAEHSGILIFVSYMERQVRIVADSGIASKISQDLWNIIADDLAQGIKSGQTKEGFISAVEKCGQLLAENFPAHEENPNELSDGLAILDYTQEEY